MQASDWEVALRSDRGFGFLDALEVGVSSESGVATFFQSAQRSIIEVFSG